MPTAKITCDTPNGRLAFSTQLEPLESVIENTFMCHIPLPEQIRKSQMRATYRVPVLPGTSLAMLINADNRMAGECLDISMNGCCLIFLPSQRAHFNKTGQITTLLIKIDGLDDLAVTVKLRRVSTTKSGQMMLGAQYLNLTLYQQNHLQNTLTHLQQSQVQKKTRLS
jgi:c-di-GMP-binding flagellar brake protein YcgR